MNVYCDTSLLVAAIAPEAATRRVHEWLERQDAGSLLISDWTITEFASALAIKLRAGELDRDQHAEAHAAWTSLRNSSLVILPVEPTDFATAAVYVERADLGLRAGDALHLAVAAGEGCALATLDRVQGKAAVKLGIPVVKL